MLLPLAMLGFQLEHLGWAEVLLLFVGLGGLIVALARRSMAGLGGGRKWTAVGLRVALLAVLLLIVGGLRVERKGRDVEVMIVRDVSLSTSRLRGFPGAAAGESVPMAVERFLGEVVRGNKPDTDRVGVISFAQQPLIESMPSLRLGETPQVIRDVAGGTDIGAALMLATATFSEGAMRRIVLVTDGNNTSGDVERALGQLAALNIPVDVVPLRYQSTGEVVLERLTTPTWRRENEPFTIDLALRSTADAPVTGRLTVLHQGVPMALGEDGTTARRVTLRPGSNVERVRVPGLRRPGVHEFQAIFEPDDEGAAVAGGSGGGTRLLANRTASGFTFVRGRGQILYVNNVGGPEGMFLVDALQREGIGIQPENVISPERFPSSLLQLQDYDAVILANVPRGMGGLSDEQQQVLAAYVHELGGGLVMIGGEQAFGAGGWSGSRLEQVLPVDMDVPARREIAKGALVLLMHSCEMPDGNYWGEQCAIKAVEALSERDDVGVVSYAWRGIGGSGAQWDFPLQPRGDGGKAIAAIKNMQLGDMPDFEDAFLVSLNGRDGNPGLKDSDARQKHMIIISDGDPAPPSPGTFNAYRDAKITVSTVTVYPHTGDGDGLPATMRLIADRLGGRAYGPINNNPQQLPQIFIKEATVVKRSLIQEDARGFALRQAPSLTDAVKGIAVPASVTGYVLTSRKPSPQVEVPIVAGREGDPILAYWQTGLGRSIVFTSDAHNRWAAAWYASPVFDRFWAQVVRAVARPPMSAELDVQTLTVSGEETGGVEKGKVIVEASRAEGSFESFLAIEGTVVGPDLTARQLRLQQTAPGTYEALFDTPIQGNYVVSLRYAGRDGQSGFLVSGLARSASPELRDLRSNETAMAEIARRTGGRVLPPWEVAANDWWTRSGLPPRVATLPVWDYLVPLALVLLLLDVAVRRVAIDRAMVVAAVGRVRRMVQTLTHTTREEVDRMSAGTAGASTGALQRGREEVAAATGARREAPLPTVEGDLQDLVGGAKAGDPAQPPSAKDAPESRSGVGNLMAAKKRAQREIEEKRKQS